MSSLSHGLYIAKNQQTESSYLLPEREGIGHELVSSRTPVRSGLADNMAAGRQAQHLAVLGTNLPCCQQQHDRGQLGRKECVRIKCIRYCSTNNCNFCRLGSVGSVAFYILCFLAFRLYTTFGSPDYYFYPEHDAHYARCTIETINFCVGLISVPDLISVLLFTKAVNINWKPTKGEH